MSLLERRLQVLLDADRFARLEAESRSTGKSVGSIVRGAIDLHFAAEDAVDVRAAAAARLLAATEQPVGVEPEWRESKAALMADRGLNDHALGRGDA